MVINPHTLIEMMHLQLHLELYRTQHPISKMSSMTYIILIKLVIMCPLQLHLRQLPTAWSCSHTTILYELAMVSRLRILLGKVVSDASIKVSFQMGRLWLSSNWGLEEPKERKSSMPKWRPLAEFITDISFHSWDIAKSKRIELLSMNMCPTEPWINIYTVSTIWIHLKSLKSY